MPESGTADAAEENDVIAARHLGLRAAFERGERSREQRAAAEPGGVLDPLELVVGPRSKAPAERLLGRGQHIDGKCPAALKLGSEGAEA